MSCSLSFLDLLPESFVTTVTEEHAPEEIDCLEVEDSELVRYEEKVEDLNGSPERPRATLNLFVEIPESGFDIVPASTMQEWMKNEEPAVQRW